ncbi:mobilization protein [Rhizobium mesoamericanum]|uniref:mobilization protein n=1 Tax=Rhizobium mesoamericanum TaxID=1079800 RepID=UPI0027D7AD03|nr:mobilization protein [Rhizobium mesoamericanum]
MTRKTISERLAQLEARKKTLQLRLSKQERAIDTRRKVLIRALVLHRLENGDHASSSRPFLEWLQRELSKFLIREGDRELFDDLLKPHGQEQSPKDDNIAS